MGVVNGPQKEETIEIKLSQTARHRLVAGLAWDMLRTEDFSTKEKIEYAAFNLKQVTDTLVMLVRQPEYRKQHVKYNLSLEEKDDKPGRDIDDPNFDLDLACYIFNDQKELAACIDPSAWNAIDASEKIYHSDDNQNGYGWHDDEQIHIEFKDLPDDYAHFFFVVTSDCKHNLGEVLNPQIRIADSATETDFLRVDISELPDSDAFGYICCHIYKRGDSWLLKNMSTFTDHHEENWAEYLKQFI